MYVATFMIAIAIATDAPRWRMPVGRDVDVLTRGSLRVMACPGGFGASRRHAAGWLDRPHGEAAGAAGGGVRLGSGAGPAGTGTGAWSRVHPRPRHGVGSRPGASARLPGR